MGMGMGMGRRGNELQSGCTVFWGAGARDRCGTGGSVAMKKDRCEMNAL